VQPPGLRGRHAVRGAHLYLAPLRTTIRGPDLVVPVGGAFDTTSHRRTAWLAAYASNEQGGGMPGPPGAGPPDDEPSSSRELLLAIEGARPQHQRLVIQGQLPPRGGGPEAEPTAISVYDWQRHRWKALTWKADPTFALEVPEPGRFILWPPGLVRVAPGVQEPSTGRTAAVGYGLAWADVEYAGRGGGR